MFGTEIRKQVSDVLHSLDVEHAMVEMKDSGALPFVIAARLEAAAWKGEEGSKNLYSGYASTEYDGFRERKKPYFQALPAG